MEDVEDAVDGFARRIESLLVGVIGKDQAQYVQIDFREESQRFVISNTGSGGVPLKTESTEVLALAFEYECQINTAGYLAVYQSSIKVMPKHGERFGAPFFHYDYIRDHSHDIPAAHINVHASNDEMTRVMLQCGSKKRGKKRRKAFVDNGTFPTVSTLHFPLGGNLFRPGLEDVLEMLIYEFGIDVVDGWHNCLIGSRREYRTIQLKTLIREHPEIALAVLEAAGLKFEEGSVPAPRESKIDRLIAY